MCVNCKGNHGANDRKCEVFKRQEVINKTMARKGITSYVARKKKNESRRHRKEYKNGTEKSTTKLYTGEDKEIDEARGGSWVDVVTGNLHKLGERRETDKRRGEEDAGEEEEEEIGNFTKVGEERVKGTREDSIDKKNRCKDC